MLKKFTIYSLYLFPVFLYAQPGFLRVDTFRVYKNTTLLRNPWAGGHNFCQISDIDLNGDGIKDLVVFDHTGVTPFDKITTYINTGVAGQVSYYHAPQYEKKFPYVHDWMLLVDYNCDGKKDIFTYNVGGFSVYKNTSVAGNLQFTLAKQMVYSLYDCGTHNTNIPLYVSAVDIPAIADIDNDGDLDVITYELAGIKVEYHKNLSKETYGNCDSLIFWKEACCWGHFTENPSNNGINLNACTGRVNDEGNEIRYATQNPTPQHSGNCLACLDLNGDRVKDLLNGSLNFCNLNGLINGGDTTLAVMISDDPNFPSNTASVNQILFPCPFYLDVNNDGKRDLLVSPNAPNVSENTSSIIYYKNNGTDASPVFSYQQNDFLQNDMIDVGEGAYPVFFDIDADGLTDLLIGNFYSKIGPGCLSGTQKVSVTAYRNIGTPTNPVFKFQTSDYAGLQSALLGVRNFIPTFGDMDGDGDPDMVVGDENGRLHRFQNTAGVGNPPVFVQQMPADMLDNNNVIIDVGSYAAPQLFDIDGDNRIDLLIGERGGKIAYYKNTGTITNPVYTFISNSLGNIDVMPQCCTGYSTPFFFKDSGITKLMVGSEQGYIFRYNNIDGNLAGTFTLLDSMLWRPNEVWEGMRVAFTCKDVTGDGLMDMVVGNYRGGVAFYKGDLTVGMNAPLYENSSMEIYPNPAGNILNINLVNIEGTDVEFSLTDMLGQRVLTKKISGPSTVLDVSAFSDGIYLCMVKWGTKQLAKRVMIRK